MTDDVDTDDYEGHGHYGDYGDDEDCDSHRHRW